MDLFDSLPASSERADQPLAEAMRPRSLDEFIGQEHLLGAGKLLRGLASGTKLRSLILWGPPGSGKTTLAQILANSAGAHCVHFSAVSSGVKDLKKIIQDAEQLRRMGKPTVLFVDEIHHFNKSQQDNFLPHVEKGTLILIGATTENPSFELNPPLLSRAQVLVFRRLDDSALETLLTRAEALEGRALPLDADARAALRAMADGDGRYVLNLAEELFALKAKAPLDTRALSEAIQKRAPIYDKAREGHYNLVSALHKAVRGSDVDAALYWLARMFAGGEDPLYIARRVVRMAVEDIGLADPAALAQTLAAKDAYDFLGSPEGELAIAQAVIYLATAPKSNAAYSAFGKATQRANETGSLAPPMYAMNAPTRLMKDLGYSRGYQYDHDAPEAFAGANYFPPEMPRETYYEPAARGFEQEIAARLQKWAAIRNAQGRRAQG